MIGRGAPAALTRTSWGPVWITRWGSLPCILPSVVTTQLWPESSRLLPPRVLLCFHSAPSPEVKATLQRGQGDPGPQRFPEPCQ